jgi:hypothetical protein
MVCVRHREPPSLENFKQHLARRGMTPQMTVQDLSITIIKWIDSPLIDEISKSDDG